MTWSRPSGSSVRAPVLLVVAVFALSACFDLPLRHPPDAVGHPGAPVDDAVVIRVEPGAVTPYRYAGPGPRRGNPYIAVSDWLKNVSDTPVLVRSCTARAFDARGERLFITRLRILDPDGSIFRPGDEQGVADGAGTSAWVAPDGLTMRLLRRVDRYDVRCDVRTWVGPLPTYPSD